jgi:hypothetical protein
MGKVKRAYRNDNLRRARLRLERLQKGYARGQIEFWQLTQALRSWAAHLKHGDTGHLREDIFRQLIFVKRF